MKAARLFVLLLVLWVVACYGQKLESNPEIERRIDVLLEQMTLEEKIGQLHQVSGVSDTFKQQVREGKIGSFLNIHGAKQANELQRIAVEETRLKIPLIFGNDVIHGYRTVFPIPLAEAASWDPDLVEKTAAMAAREAAASGTHWTFAPMVDIARDPRWGRIAEGAGEDPYLGSVLAGARVRGFQGKDLRDPLTIVACPKHYIGYGAAQAGRDYFTVDMSLQTLLDVYLPPFKAAIEAGAGTIMSAFNELNGLPASANPYILTQLLRNELGFQGFVVSDWNAIGELLNHGVAATPAEAAKLALSAGVDMDMMGFVYQSQLSQLVKSGEIDERLIDTAVRRVLRIKFMLGLFDRPYIDPQLETSLILSKEHRELALESARKSIVLLKNEGQILPLSKNIKSLALIGPLADNKHDPLGCWLGEGKDSDVISVLEGIKTKIPSERIRYAQGCPIERKSGSGISKAVQLAKNAEVAVLVVGESEALSGEASSRASLDLPGDQEQLVKAVFATGTPTIVVLMNGRPLTIPWIAEHIPAIIEAWQLGVESGNAIADVLFGDYNPGGKLPVTFPRSVGQIPIFYNHKNSGRPPASEKYSSRYLDLPVTPQFPFGFGLSYTQFKFSNLQIRIEGAGRDSQVNAGIEVENVGKRSGDEVVQLYIRDLVGSLARPVKELKRFQRIHLQPGEKKLIEFQLSANELGFHNQNLEYVVEPGAFKIWIGNSSVDGLEASFEIAQSPK
ncbi:MAG: glycoside hydrolase family 3 C-terminal domain-containing protein [candidate division KSB1 bacterium]|nr:glycoside hydrolase family 3 C-terminal domain-containing protein [candidate division KSB1 bacterium]MDZ7334798.1 glycoside hydrolase family 3 C-terminal domain-containing protein [candidate division KSB1 bacterium]MDZ7400795.1 glycoside hydrolase family 3 C-terminal domain-containing protein [candidate division KSB1 bacterium]